MKGWAWPHGSSQTPPARASIWAPPALGTEGDRWVTLDRKDCKAIAEFKEKKLFPILTITLHVLSIFIIMLQLSFKVSINSSDLSLLSSSPLCTWHFVALHKNGVAKMSKLLQYHSQSLLSAELFACYLNLPVFISACSLLNPRKSLYMAKLHYCLVFQARQYYGVHAVIKKHCFKFGWFFFPLLMHLRTALCYF